jgi:ankyrin repeat protein
MGGAHRVRVADNGDDMIVQLLLTKANIELKSEDEQTAVDMATINGHSEFVPLLLKNEAKVDTKDWNDWTPLYWGWGANKGNIEVAQ